MKYNKIVCFFSFILSFITLIGYLLFNLIAQCQIGEDICISIFGSSILLSFTTLVGYLVEKKNSQSKISSIQIKNVYTEITLSFNSSNPNILTVRSAVRSVYQNCLNMYDLLFDYYKGCIIKPKNLKQILQNNLRNYAEELSKFEVYLSSELRKESIIVKKLEKLSQISDTLAEDLLNWQKKSHFKLGKEFDIGENFISQYESED